MTDSGNGDDEGRDNGLSPEDRARFRDRLSELDERLGSAQERHSPPAVNSRGRGMGYALRLAFDMIGAVVVGGGIGWFIDRWLGSAPAMLLIFGALGVAAGFMNVLRTYRQMVADSGPQASGQAADSRRDED